MNAKVMTFLNRLTLLWGCFLWAHPGWTIDRYVATTGSDTTDCSVSANPCLTLQYTVNQSTVSDVIHVASGTYSVVGLTTINKTLTILGAQAGVDARTRVFLESILSNTQGISVSASNVVIDGFTIQDSSSPAFTGYGLWLNPGVNGSRIVNNIFRNNIVGLGLANVGTTQALVEHNLFQQNNIVGPGSGTGIYTDEFASGALSNVLINENRFFDNDNAGIGFSSSDPTRPTTNITITGNDFDANGRGIYFQHTRSASATFNTFTNLTAPTDGGLSVAFGVFGGNENLAL